MDTVPYRPPEFEKCASDLPSPYGPAVDIVSVSGDEIRLKKEWGIDRRILPLCNGSGRRQYSLETIERIYSTLDESSTDAKQSTPDPISRLARHREHTQRITAPIIFVVRGSGRRKLSQLLQRTRRPCIGEPDSISPILNSTYGIISLPTPRRQRLLHTCLLATGQLMCCAMMRNYEISHGTTQLTRASLSLTPLLEYLQTPSTFLFVLVALTHGVLATLQYHINQTDRLQKPLLVGLLIGSAAALPSLIEPDQGLAVASALATSMLFALTFSAVVHWFWRTFLNTTKRRLDCTIDRWAREALEVDTKEHVVKFQEII